MACVGSNLENRPQCLAPFNLGFVCEIPIDLYSTGGILFRISKCMKEKQVHYFPGAYRYSDDVLS